MTNSSRILFVFTLAGALFLPVAASAQHNHGGLDPSLTPAARAKVHQRDLQVNRAMGRLEGTPRANGRVFGQVDTDAAGNFLIPGIHSGPKGTTMSGAPRGADTGPVQRLGVGSHGTGGRLGTNSVPKIGGSHVHSANVHSASAGAPKVSVNVGAPKVGVHVPTSTVTHTVRH